ncbi:MAG: BrnT family toxin [Pyrinomonadaceae bacterium]
MQFEWDDVKAERNSRIHGISFEEAKTVFSDPLFVVFNDVEHSQQEQRYIIMGESYVGRVLVVAYTEREMKTRLISAREATRKERQSYEQEI